MIIEIEKEYQSDAGTTKYTPHLAPTGELWGVFCEYLWENQPRYNGTALYIYITCKPKLDLFHMSKWHSFYHTDITSVESSHMGHVIYTETRW